MTSKTLTEQMQQIGQAAKQAANELATTATEQKNQALNTMAQQLKANQHSILSANQQDIAAAKAKGLAPVLIDRLLLNEARINAIAASLHAIAKLADPVGRTLAEWSVPSGLQIRRVSTPLGVIGIIYEARPNVTADAAGLCLKAGNAVILRGGSESTYSNLAILHSLHQALKTAGISQQAIQYLPTPKREAVDMMLSMADCIDVIIPRGGKSLIQRVEEISKIPLLKHLEGNCHTYIHAQSDPVMASKIVLNAKMRRPSICGATETILLDQAACKTHLEPLLNALKAANCEVRGDQWIQAAADFVKPAQVSDWQTEYLAPIVAIKTVPDIQAAIAHIQRYGSNHTEAIICDNPVIAEQFLNTINSAIVMHNCSTQFADGGEFGMGAEIGIATGKLHARGPVGVEQLTTFKYQVRGSGQVRD